MTTCVSVCVWSRHTDRTPSFPSLSIPHHPPRRYTTPLLRSSHRRCRATRRRRLSPPVRRRGRRRDARAHDGDRGDVRGARARPDQGRISSDAVRGIRVLGGVRRPTTSHSRPTADHLARSRHPDTPTPRHPDTPRHPPTKDVLLMLHQRACEPCAHMAVYYKKTAGVRPSAMARRRRMRTPPPLDPLDYSDDSEVCHLCASLAPASRRTPTSGSATSASTRCASRGWT